MIINSILDTDLYKLTMGQALMFKFPDVYVRYLFNDRNNLIYPNDFDKALKEEIKKMSNLYLTQEEEFYLRSIPFLKNVYIDFLKGYRFNPAEVIVSQDNIGHLNIKIIGHCYKTIYWEVPLLAIISELYYKMTNQKYPYTLQELNLRDYEKLAEMIRNNVNFSEFGTRRRASYENQDRLINLFVNKSKELGNSRFVGTSNVHFAQKYNIKPIGTMAHEWIMCHGALYGYRMANKLAFDNWVDVYGGNLGIALSDTYTTDIFLKDFDMKFSKLFDGVRHDSGNPYEFTDKIINHYKKYNIDSLSKTIIFSNALDIKTSIKIKNYCKDKIKCSFGIGTHLTNDIGLNPMNIVIKLSDVFKNDEWVPAIKLSDDKGKHTGNKKEIEIAKYILTL